jgi:cell division protease FtsH
MAKALMELETIDSDQVNDIMAGLPPRPSRELPSKTEVSASDAATSPDAEPDAQNPA